MFSHHIESYDGLHNWTWISKEKKRKQFVILMI
jgi:hypothetical protein